MEIKTFVDTDNALVDWLYGPAKKGDAACYYEYDTSVKGWQTLAGQRYFDKHQSDVCRTADKAWTLAALGVCHLVQKFAPDRCYYLVVKR